MIELTDDELVTALDALDARRETLLAERADWNLLTVTLSPGDALPAPDTLDGQIFRLAALFGRMQSEHVKREEAKGRSGNLLRVSGQLRPCD